MLNNNEIVEKSMLASLRSIRKHGICPLNQVNLKETHPNFVLGVQEIHKNVCVNDVNLQWASPAEIDSALKLAVWEEYCGIAGITVERAWPFQKLANTKLMQKEIMERIKNNVIFILKPPPHYIIHTTPHGGEKAIPISGYTRRDGFSQSRGETLVDDVSLLGKHRLLEIKTEHHFKQAEILAIMVPEELVSLVQAAFAGTDVLIIAVPYQEVQLTKVPQILHKLHGERLAAPFMLKAPDYHRCLLDFAKKHQRFAIHCVRLHTQFDFRPHYFANLQEQEHLLKKLHATQIIPSVNPGGFVLLHKGVGFSRMSVIEKIRREKQLPEANIAQLIENVLPHEEVYKAIVKAKGCYTQTMVYVELSKWQMQQFDHKQISYCPYEADYVMLAFKPDQEKTVLAILKNRELLPAVAATTIQALFRGYHVRAVVQDFKIKLTQQKQAQKALEDATAAVDQAATRMFALP